jgi:DNA-binding transcriptional regulator YbjK
MQLGGDDQLKIIERFAEGSHAPFELSQSAVGVACFWRELEGSYMQKPHPSLSLKMIQRTYCSGRTGVKASGRYSQRVARVRDQTRRRRELVSATATLVSRKGLSSVKLRDVADAAGLTSGAVLYYYESLDELFTAAYDRAIERFCRQRERAIASIEDPAERLATAVRMAIPSGPDDHEIRLLYELEPVAFRDEACAALMSAYIERQIAMYATILEVGAATGVFTLSHDARTIARNLISLEDGQGLYVVMDRDRPDEVERRIFDYLAAVTGVDRRRFEASLRT